MFKIRLFHHNGSMFSCSCALFATLRTVHFARYCCCCSLACVHCILCGKITILSLSLKLVLSLFLLLSLARSFSLGGSVVDAFLLRSSLDSAHSESVALIPSSQRLSPALQSLKFYPQKNEIEDITRNSLPFVSTNSPAKDNERKRLPALFSPVFELCAVDIKKTRP